MKITFLSLLFSTTSGLSWLGLHRYSNEEMNLCEFEGLTRPQKRLCQKYPQFQPALKAASLSTINLCKSTMKGHLWGCQGADKLPAVGPELSQATSESAFVHALGAGQLLAALKKICRSGATGSCDEAELRMFAIQFTDVLAMSRRAKGQKTVELHNNDVGRTTADRHSRLVCKCHGQSGSCTQKTCWRGSPDPEKVATELSAKYESAAKVRAQDELPAIFRQYVVRDRLLYIKNSINHCETTHGRECNPESTEKNSCDRLCCGRGNIQRVLREPRRECKMETIKVDGSLWPAGIKCNTVYDETTSFICR
ncbi:Oidioi.mRNA.OKI2018_I69.PAR.g11127.t1.cds [Oikopleura dioica]|uniref:Protein Wnt n=1 Tax=Oikopleura dioica TaxID=34765 RepID=A0ABN7RXH0_OIKDI|nr:Oidioi.mRNA.OKI2018_I69.PAR.g11127.t1.cds [Oikopleura dioica]